MILAAAKNPLNGQNPAAAEPDIQSFMAVYRLLHVDQGPEINPLTGLIPAAGDRRIRRRVVD